MRPPYIPWDDEVCPRRGTFLKHFAPEINHGAMAGPCAYCQVDVVHKRLDSIFEQAMTVVIPVERVSGFYDNRAAWWAAKEAADQRNPFRRDLAHHQLLILMRASASERVNQEPNFEGRGRPKFW